MYYCLILYSYTHCTFEQMGVQAICTDEQVFRIAEQIDTKKGSIAAPPQLKLTILPLSIPQFTNLLFGDRLYTSFIIIKDLFTE